MFTGKHLSWSLFSNKSTDLRHLTLLKRKLQHRCFPVNIEQACNFIKTRLQHKCFPVNIAKFFKNTRFGKPLGNSASGQTKMQDYFKVISLFYYILPRRLF